MIWKKQNKTIFKIGDIVKIIAEGQIFGFYGHWPGLNKVKNNWKDTEGWCKYNTIGKIIHIGPHCNGFDIALIRCPQQFGEPIDVIIDLKGLEKTIQTYKKRMSQ